jgi:hypothetical protein
MSAPQETGQTAVLAALASALEPLGVLASPNAMGGLLRELGWDFPPAQQFSEDFRNVTSAVEDLLDMLRTLDEPASDEQRVERIAALSTKAQALIAVAVALPRQVRRTLDLLPEFRDRSDLEIDFPRRLLDYLVVRQLVGGHPLLHDLLALVGLVEYRQVPAEPERFRLATRVSSVHWERAPSLVTDPRAYAELAYRWDSGFDAESFVGRLQVLARRLGFIAASVDQDPRIRAAFGRPAGETEELRVPLFVRGADPASYFEGGLRLFPAPARDGRPRGLALMPYVIGGGGHNADLSRGFEVALALSAGFEQGIAVMLRPPHDLELLGDVLGSPAEPSSASISAALRRRADASGAVTLLGSPGQARVTLRDAGAVLSATKLGELAELTAEARFEGLSLIVPPGDVDGFLKSAVPAGGLSAGFDLAIGWSSLRGVYLGEGAGLEVTVPLHRTLLGALEIDSIYVALAPDDGALVLDVAASGAVMLGPVRAAIERVGLRSEAAFPGAGGNFGPAQFDGFRFRPPDGAALSIDAGAVTGGGFLKFSPDEAQYSGALQLQFEGVSVDAVGILTTRLPGGRPGYSLVILVQASGFAPMQLGFGFALTGVGGLLGVNRGVNLDVLRAGLKSHALDPILFTRDDPIRRAGEIVSALETAFPPVPDSYVFGPLAQITWGTPPLLRIEVALLLQLPAPLRLILLGRIAAALPDEEDAVIRINLDALGVVDLDRREASVDAVLHDSKIAEFALTGEMALRAGWGEVPQIALALGGFHPRYAAPPGFPRLERLALTLSTGDNPRLRLEAYLALTSNTVQFGGRIDFYVAVGALSLQGALGFDTLIDLARFGFVADVAGKLVLKWGDDVLFGVDVFVTLSGPAPWWVRGHASFDLLGWKQQIEFDRTFGEPAELPPLELVDVGALLADELAKPASWSAQLPAGVQVATYRAGPGDGTPLAHPGAALTVTQRLVPLEREIAKLGAATPASERHFDVSLHAGAKAWNQKVSGYFAPAQFFDLSDDEKLAAPSFDTMPAGVRAGEDAHASGPGVEAEIVYETWLLTPDGATPPAAAAGYALPEEHLEPLAQVGAAANAEVQSTGRARYRGAELGIEAGDTAYAVARSDLRPVPGVEETDGSYTAARQALFKRARERPEEELQIVAGYETVGSA